LCEKKGWTVAEVYTDNDVSATTGRHRPSFEALLSSNPRRIVVWHVDRLVRLSKDLERVIDLGVNVYAVKSGHVDLSNPAGRAVAKTITAWAQYEGEQKATRQVAANLQRAQRGQVLWTRRPFGFDRAGAKVRIVKPEAVAIRDAAKKVLKGATLASIAADWNARGITTTTGGHWSVTSVRRVLLNPRTAGRVVSRGEDYGSNALAILDADTAVRLAAMLRDPRRRLAPSTAVKYLLSGLARCGRDGCGTVMFATMTQSRSSKRYMAYRCNSCYLMRHLGKVDEVVEAVVLARLSRPDAVLLLGSDVDIDELRREATEIRDNRDALAAMLRDRLLSAAAVRREAQRMTDQIDVLERQIEAATGSSPLSQIIGVDDVSATWHGLTLPARRGIVSELAQVTILPAGKGVRFRREDVLIEWNS